MFSCANCQETRQFLRKSFTKREPMSRPFTTQTATNTTQALAE